MRDLTELLRDVEKHTNFATSQSNAQAAAGLSEVEMQIRSTIALERIAKALEKACEQNEEMLVREVRQ